MRSFSDELAEDRQFELGGEVFKWRYPYWEELATIFDEDVELLRVIEEDAEKRENGGAAITTKQTMQRTQKRIELFLDPENAAQKRWAALVKRRTDPVPLYQYGEVYRWLLEVTGRRPTTSPSDSEPGAGSIEASSPVESL